MLEWLLGAGCVGLYLYAVVKEKKRPQRRQIHCKIEFVDHGDYLDLMVSNGYGVEITASFDWLKLQGVRAEGPLPQTSVIPGFQEIAVARLWKISKTPLYSVDWQWVWGSIHAQHDSEALYHLPYKAGQSFSISQGPGGAFTHKGESHHAVDFDMPVGTPVLAARAGLVVDLESDFRARGLSREAGGNYVLVQHDDRTVAEYFHLRTDGVKVSIGDEVQVGELLAYSGDTGCSNGPHLHLMVFRAEDGTRRESLPMRFRVQGRSEAVVLETGHQYTSCCLNSRERKIAR